MSACCAGGTATLLGQINHVELDARSEMHGKEAALVFQSCYVANDTTLSTVMDLSSTRRD